MDKENNMIENNNLNCKNIDELFDTIFSNNFNKDNLNNSIINKEITNEDEDIKIRTNMSSNLELSPDTSNYTLSTGSTILDLTHRNSETTITTNEVGDSEILLNDQSDFFISSKSNNDSFNANINSINNNNNNNNNNERSDRIIFDPYNNFFPNFGNENSISNDVSSTPFFKSNIYSPTNLENFEEQFEEIYNPTNVNKLKDDSSINYIYKPRYNKQNKNNLNEEKYYSPNDKQPKTFFDENNNNNFFDVANIIDDNEKVINYELEKYGQDVIMEGENDNNNNDDENNEFSVDKNFNSPNNESYDLINILPKVLQSLNDLPKLSHAKHLCVGCFKVSKTSYGCSRQIIINLPNIKQYKEYNTPNGYTLEYAKKHGDPQYIYVAAEAKNEYDPIVKRYTTNIQYNSKGKRMKRDYPSLCPFCKVTDKKKFDSLFYERNNSCYRGHLINTHGISSLGEFAKLPKSGFVCYKLGKNCWSKTIGFKCPYENCDFCFLRGDKTHGFHEYIRHWNKSHIE